MRSFTIHPVGTIERQGDTTGVHIADAYTDALRGLQDFSHMVVLYWFDENDTTKKRATLQVHPRGNQKNPLTGVFACRAPVRPNLIAMSVCKILGIEGPIIRIDHIDAFDGSPVIDIKPYIPAIDRAQENVTLPAWLLDGK